MTTKKEVINLQFDAHQRIVAALIVIDIMISNEKVNFDALKGARINLEKAENIMEFVRGKSWTSK